MRSIYFFAVVVGTAVSVGAAVQAGSQQPTASGQSQQSGQQQGQGPGQGWRGNGAMRFPAGGRGVLGTVTEVAADHYTIKTESGETYTVHYSANTRIMKQGAGRRRPGAGGQSAAGNGNGTDDADRQPPQPLKPTDIKVGDIITAGGEMDEAGKSIGAVFIAQIDPERAKQMREMQANYGKTWLAGRITGIDGTKITIEGMVDHAPHAIEVDENTSFRQRRDSITLADIKPGEQLRAEGGMKNGVFLATTVVANQMPNREPGGPPGDGQFSPAPNPK